MKNLVLTSFLFFFTLQSKAETISGVTIDSIAGVKATVDALAYHSVKPTARIVFDEFVPASQYTTFLTKISPYSFIMGELLDSYYMSQYSNAQFATRVDEYLNTLGTKVNIWEIGNEINGEWLGPTADTVTKMYTAYSKVKARNGKAALTLYYNPNCWAKKENEMFTWAAANVPTEMKQNLDYVWISYYEDDCEGYRPTQAQWQQVFDKLGQMFPNSKIGFGEIGTTRVAKKADMVNRYYRMKITHPRFVGGYFWWYYKQDAVPRTTKPLWKVLDDAFIAQPKQ
ncbi:hypothetical protein [Bdellovibrio sp. HCB2-146]|uniref:hypothetical protein n=1 Tax=Bdellovibrio sp. HCB2-146 TaxID=3394362 RepID=UPI0039BC7B8B